MKTNICILFFGLITSFLWAQNTQIAKQQNQTSVEQCAAMDILEYHINNNPLIEQQRKVVETHIDQVLSNKKVSKKIKEVITIPVVFHIIYKNSNEQLSEDRVLSQLDVLNEDFRMTNANADETIDVFKDRAADLEIEFCLAQENPEGLPTSGIVYYPTDVSYFPRPVLENQFTDSIKFAALGGADVWNRDNYLNIWVGDLEDLEGITLGYAQFPGMDSNTDGVALDFAYVGKTGIAPNTSGRTATHEVGHWINLRHIWGDGPCDVDDGVADTPPAEVSNTGCNTMSDSCPGDNEPDMVQNYMDYSSDSCVSLFTEGQKEIARAVFEPGGPREAILSSTKCIPPVLADNDVRLIEVTNVQNNLNFCSSVFTPSVRFRNYGNNALNKVTVETYINNELVDTYIWTGDVATSDFVETALNEINVPQGQNKLKIVISGVNSTPDDKPDDNEIVLNIQSLGRAIPFTEDFEDADFPPAFSNIIDMDNDGESFELKSGVAYAGNNCMYINCFEYGRSGAIDELVLPLMDLSNTGNPMLTFYNAYARYDSEDSDTLEILASKDCGLSYQSIYKQQGVFIATVGNRQEAFEPASENQWKQRLVDLKAYEGESEVSVKFRCINSHEQNLYIDQIEVTGDTMIPVYEKILEALQVYPNPVSALLFIESSREPIQKIFIRSINGKILVESTYVPKLNLAELAPGIYFVEMEIENNTYTKKIMKL